MTLPSGSGERLLVVDDEPDIAALVSFHLVKAGYRVSTAANGTDAIAQTRAERPVLVVLDLMLPGMSGYDVLEQLRADDATRDRLAEMKRTAGDELGARSFYATTLEAKGHGYDARSEWKALAKDYPNEPEIVARGR